MEEHTIGYKDPRLFEKFWPFATPSEAVFVHNNNRDSAKLQNVCFAAPCLL